MSTRGRRAFGLVCASIIILILKQTSTWQLSTAPWARDLTKRTNGGHGQTDSYDTSKAIEGPTIADDLFHCYVETGSRIDQDMRTPLSKIGHLPQFDTSWTEPISLSEHGWNVIIKHAVGSTPLVGLEEVFEHLEINRGTLSPPNIQVLATHILGQGPDRSARPLSQTDDCSTIVRNS